LEGVDWMHLARDVERWWDIVNMGLNLRVPKKAKYVLSESTISLSRSSLLRM
jgi:hypothetical protein